MDLATALERFGDSTVLATGGALIGCAFGFFAQRSRFCLRAAVVDFWNGNFGEKLSVWLFAFSTSVVAVQIMLLTQILDVSTSRQISARGSLSGALIGGLLFGGGMIMTRGCASRLLVLSANGNLRALLSGLIFAVAAQASLSGALSPLRLAMSEWWIVDGGASRDLLAIAGVGHWGGLVFGLFGLAAAVYISWKNSHPSPWLWAGGAAVGLTVATGWWFNYQVSIATFEDPVTVQSLSFAGPSAEWLMRVLSPVTPRIGFEFGLLPGVFVGSFLGAWYGHDLKIEGFKDGYSMTRYIAGAILMGFGAMLAGGCAVGAGMTGGSIFALTAWLTLVGMWVGAGLLDRWLDYKPSTAHFSTAKPAIVKAP